MTSKMQHIDKFSVILLYLALPYQSKTKYHLSVKAKGFCHVTLSYCIYKTKRGFSISFSSVLYLYLAEVG